MNKFFGKETLSAIKNFNISNHTMHKDFIIAIIEIKRAAAITNKKLKNIPNNKSNNIVNVCDQLIKEYDENLFPIDVFQTGSGTSTNMNVNEVIALKSNTHPNDDVNWGQSSNCVIPSAINLANIKKIDKLIYSLKNLEKEFKLFAFENKGVIKIGRTHLQDAVPLSVKQEFMAFKNIINQNIKRLTHVKKELEYIPIGGTAVGTGIASHPEFSREICLELSKRYKFNVKVSKNKFKSISTREEQVILMNALATLSSSMIKISNDLRLLSSGPNTGLHEITFKKIQAGSSVMPGKVNPVIMEMMIQVATYIIGNSMSVNIANQNGPLQLNMMMPLISYLTIDSLEILKNAIDTFSELGVKKIKINKKVIDDYLYKSSAIITILKNHPKVGYDLATEFVLESEKKGITIFEVIQDKNIFTDKEIKKIFNFKKMV